MNFSRLYLRSLVTRPSNLIFIYARFINKVSRKSMESDGGEAVHERNISEFTKRRWGKNYIVLGKQITFSYLRFLFHHRRHANVSISRQCANRISKRRKNWNFTSFFHEHRKFLKLCCCRASNDFAALMTLKQLTTEKSAEILVVLMTLLQKWSDKIEANESRARKSYWGCHMVTVKRFQKVSSYWWRKKTSKETFLSV